MSLIDNLNEIKRQKEEYIIPGNIKKDVIIFDVTGTLEGETGWVLPDGICFSDSKNSTFPKLIATNITDAHNMFKDNTNLTGLDIQFGEGKLTNTYSMFQRSSLINAPSMDLSMCINTSNMFENCQSLVNIPIYNLASMPDRGFSSMVLNCTSLSNESLNNIMASLLTITSYVNPARKTLRYVGLSQEQVTVCQGLSNYQTFIDAGWTTGY